jgi:beta-mannosidase
VGAAEGGGGGGGAITDVVPEVFYRAAHPTSSLSDGTHAGFVVRTRVYLWSPRGMQGRLRASGSWGDSESAALDQPAGESVVHLNLSATAQQVKLWWPAGLGVQALYNLTVRVEQPASGGSGFETTRTVGFRVMSLVTTNDTDPAERRRDATADGSGTLGILWRINGAPIWSRGANMIPMVRRPLRPF